MSVILDALRDLSAATNETDLSRVAMRVMRDATPLEVAALAGNPAVPPGKFRDWLVQLDRNVARHHAGRTAYRHRRLADSVSVFSRGEGAAGDRILVVGVCGQAHMLCSPTAILLQYFPDEEYDVVVLRDPARRGYTTGSLGYADTFAGLVERLRSDLDIARYAGVRTLGVSSGGAAAVTMGLLFGASASVSLCGRPPTFSASYGTSEPAIAMDAILRNAPQRGESTFAVFGADNATDSRNAHGLAALTSLRLLPIEGLPDHNLVTPLHRRGELDALFRTVRLL